MAKKRQDKQKARRKCHGTNQNGDPCGAQPLKPGTVIEEIAVSGQWCRRHDPDLPEKAQFGSRAQHGEIKNPGRKRKPTMPQVMREVIENNLEHMLKPYASAIGMEVRRIDAANGGSTIQLIKDPQNKGATLFGESKDGEIVMTDYPDLEAQQKAAERMLDRVYGRPKQATELSFGAGDDEDPPEVPGSDDRALEVALILKQTGGMSMSQVNVNTNGGNGAAKEE